MPASIQPAVIGATGFVGSELTRLLLSHPKSRTPLLLHHRENGGADGATKTFADPASQDRDFPIEQFTWERLEQSGVDLLFLCTPHDVSRRLVPEAMERGHRVVDLSGAWRLKEAGHRAVYRFEDTDSAAAARLDNEAVYGIPELHEDGIAGAKLVANPGCYATSIILALAAWIQGGLLDLDYGVVCDSKSGVSGAGKEPTPRTHFVEVSNNFSAYTVFGHRHTGEVLEQLGLGATQLQFTPHLLPIPRGILSTIYVRAAEGTSAADLEQSLLDLYARAPFVRVLRNSRLPEIKSSLHTNYCDIGFALGPDGRRVVLVSCLDNLVKGAAGQGVQNMNVMMGWDQREGLS